MCWFNEPYSKEDFEKFESELAKKKMRVVGLTGSLGVADENDKILEKGWRNSLMRWWWPDYVGQDKCSW